MDHLLQAEADYLSRPLRLEAEKVKSDAKSRVTWVNQTNFSSGRNSLVGMEVFVAASTVLKGDLDVGFVCIARNLKKYLFITRFAKQQ